MFYYDDQLQTLHRAVLRKRQLETMLSELREQREDFSRRVNDLRSNFLDEEKDVDKLEGKNLSAIFYRIIGKSEEKLNKERQEAYAAQMKYNAAQLELEAVEGDLQRLKEELSAFSDCEARYQQLFSEKAAYVKNSDSTYAKQILSLEEHISYIGNQLKELYEATHAGRSALSAANSVLSSLSSAEGWGVWDVMGGGFIADLAKHSQLDTAQREVQQLQAQLRRFKTELADITIQADLHVNVDGFLRFADYFFDGLFADWAVMNRISASKGQVQQTKYQIESVLTRLDSMIYSANRELTESRAKLDDLILRASV